MTIGQRIKMLRKSKGINQIKLAEDLGITNSALSQYESDQRKVDDLIKKKIAEYFHVSMDYLLGMSELFDGTSLINSIPLIKQVCGKTQLLESENIIHKNVLYSPTDTSDYFALLSDDFIMPEFFKSAIIIARKQSFLQTGEIGVFLINNKSPQIRIYIYEEDGITLKATNNSSQKHYTYNDINLLPVEIIGKVVEFRAFT